MKSLPLAADVETDRAVSTTPEVDALLAAGAPVAIGVSGGKDSSAVAIATVAHLDAIGHTGPRLLIHADLGVTEWADSLPTCERLARHLGLELVVVHRPQGDMMDRWEQRWRDNVARWESLSCVKLILPWSTAAMRYCTAELKIDQITRALSRLWAGRTILNVTGIRRAESNERADAPVAKVCKKLTSVERETDGFDWNPIVTWSTPDVYAYAKEQNFPLHEAYTRWGSSRVSCIACILGTLSDHQAAARDPRNHACLRRMADLEITSTFAFQSRWLGDTVAHLLTDGQRARLLAAKDRGAAREKAEAGIPKHLLYTKNWPTCVPTTDEAILLGAVRWQVADVVGLRKTFIRADEIIARYEELLAEKARRDAVKAKKARKAGAS